MRIELWHVAIIIFPSLVLLHLWVAPFTKVEESFNIQATHDILTYGIPTQNVHLKFKAQYDHMIFPGAVPRTFVGALVLSGIVKPFQQYFNLTLLDQQHLVRAILGLLNALALLYYGYGVRRAFGQSTAVWYILLQASQFHVFFYASRTLPNTFAFALNTVATRFLLPDPTSSLSQIKRTRLALYILTVTTIVFRAELALILASHVTTLLLSAYFNSNSIPVLVRSTILPPLFSGAVAGLALTVPIDTYFWRQSLSPRDYLWPELSAFVANIFPSISSDNPAGASAWGTSPFLWYFTSAIPRLFINPLLLILLLASISPFFPQLRPTIQSVQSLILPNLQFTLLYSVLPHKETRFIFPTIPPLTTALALSAAYISDRASRSLTYKLTTYTLLISTLLTAIFSHAILLPLSSLSYPGGLALTSLHTLSTIYPPQREIHAHLSNLALQTGVTHFLQHPPPSSPLVILAGSPDGTHPTLRSGATKWIYDKSSNDTGDYKSEKFWRQFDYVVVEDPEHALPVGGWDVVDTIYGLASPEVVARDVGRGLLVLGDDGIQSSALTQSDQAQSLGYDRGIHRRRHTDGITRVLRAMYGDGVVGRVVVWGYGVVHDVFREGYGIFGGRSLTGGRWVHWGMERRLFVLKRSPNLVGVQ